MLRREFLKWMGAAAGALLCGTLPVKVFADDADLDLPYQDGKDPAYSWIDDTHGVATLRLTGEERKRLVLPKRSCISDFMAVPVEDARAIRREYVGVLAIWLPVQHECPIMNWAMSRAGFRFCTAPGREIITLDGQLDASQRDGDKRFGALPFRMDTMFSFMFRVAPPSPA